MGSGLEDRDNMNGAGRSSQGKRTRGEKRDRERGWEATGGGMNNHEGDSKRSMREELASSNGFCQESAARRDEGGRGITKRMWMERDEEHTQIS